MEEGKKQHIYGSDLIGKLLAETLAQKARLETLTVAVARVIANQEDSEPEEVYKDLHGHYKERLQEHEDIIQKWVEDTQR